MQKFLHEKFKYFTKEIVNDDDIEEMIKIFKRTNPKTASYDTETTGLNIITDKPFLIIFGFANNVFYWEATNTNVTKAMYQLAEQVKMLWAHNAKYDYHMMYNLGLPIPDNITLADTMTLARLVDSADDEHASLRLEKIGEKYVDKSAKFAGNIIKEELQKLKNKRKTIVCSNYKLLTGEKSFTDAWNTFVDRIQFITKYHEAFNDYVEPTYYDVYKEQRDLVINYAIDDVVIMLEFIKRAGNIYFKKYADENGVIDNYVLDRENNLIRPIAAMERVGFNVDIEYVINAHYKVENYKNKLYEKLHRVTNATWKVGQHQAIKEYFKEQFNLDLPSVDKKAINMLVKHENIKVAEIAKIIKKLRTVDKWLSTYIDGILNKVQQVDGEWRLYTTVNNNGAVSGRVTSDFQQMPKFAVTSLDDSGEELLDEPLTDDDDTELFYPRKFVIPSKDYSLYYFDYSQVELRLQALYTILVGSPDVNLCRAYMPFNCYFETIGEDWQVTKTFFDHTQNDLVDAWNVLKNGHPDGDLEDLLKQGWSIWKHNEDDTPWHPTDLHSATASAAFPDIFSKLEHGSKEHKYYRGLGKNTNFGSVYGVGVRGLMDMLNVKEDIATALLNGFKQSFPNVKTYQNHVQAELNVKGYVTNIYGRKYYLTDNGNFYKANNYLVQGSAADMLKEVEIKIHNYLKDKKSRFVMPIHDEVVIEIHNDEESYVPQAIRKIMVDVKDKVSYIPIISEVEMTKTTWANKKGVEV